MRDVFKPCEAKIPRANDTSFGVGHAPFSEVETIVMAASDYIDNTLRPEMPVIGQDIKIIGLRDRDEITLTIALGHWSTGIVRESTSMWSIRKF